MFVLRIFQLKFGIKAYTKNQKTNKNWDFSEISLDTLVEIVKLSIHVANDIRNYPIVYRVLTLWNSCDASKNKHHKHDRFASLHHELGNREQIDLSDFVPLSRSYTCYMVRIYTWTNMIYLARIN
jgi:hypothetical protein